MPSRTELLAVAAAALLAGLGALGNGFVFDDRTVIVENPKVRSADLRGIWSAPSWFPEPGDRGWRPLTSTTFAVQRALHGEDPRPFRALNLGLHAAVSLLVLALARALGTPGRAPLFAGLLFALHPIHTEVLNPIVGRADLLASSAVLGGALLYLRGRAGAAALALSLGLLAKESAAALVLLAPLLELELRRRGGKDRRLKPALLRLAVLGGGLAVALALRRAATGFWTPAGDAVSGLDNPLAALPGPARAMNALYVIGRYVALLAWPWPLSADYSFDTIPALGALAPRNLAAAAFLALAAAGLRRAGKARPEALFCGGFFLLSLLPASNLLFPVGTIMAERLMYLPSAGLCILAGTALASAGRAAVPLTLAVLSLFGGLCARRNADWKDDTTIFLRTLETAPRSAKAMGNAAQALFTQGRFAEARDLNLRVIALVDQFPLPFSNLGLDYMAMGELAAAEGAFRKALERDPGYVDAWVNLGIVFARTRHFDGAVDCFQKALALMPAQTPPRLPAKLHTNMGLALKQRGESLFLSGEKAEARASFARAKTEYEGAMALDPSYEDPRRNYEALRPWLERASGT